MLVAHLTDSHLDCTDTTRDRIRRVARELAAATKRVDVIVVTGDTVEGSAFDDTASMVEEYRLVHDLLAPLAPVTYCPGNSDGEAFDLWFLEGQESDGSTNWSTEWKVRAVIAEVPDFDGNRTGSEASGSAHAKPSAINPSTSS